MTDIELKINLPKEIYDEICRFDGKHDVLINRGILYDAIKDGFQVMDRGEVMYVIGTKYGFLNVESRTMMQLEPIKLLKEVEKVIYECDLSEATIYNDYGYANKIVKEIKERIDEITFENCTITGKLFDDERGYKFNVEELKIYELVPTECVLK